jgi:hypothetical protein
VAASQLAGAAPVKANKPPTLSKPALLAGGPGGLDDHGDVWGRVSNLTPYTWTLVKAQWCSINAPGCSGVGTNVQPPATVQPGQDYVYAARLYNDLSNSLGTAWYFDVTIIYRAQTPTGPEDLTIRITGCHCTGFSGSSELVVQIYNSKPGGEIGWTQSDPVFSDVQFQIQGHFTIDASKDPPALVNVINALCSGATGTTCSFTVTGPLTWGVGDPVLKATAENCTIQSGKRSTTRAGLGLSEAPPDLDPNWHRFTVTQARTASISVGGSLTVSTEVSLFGIVGTAVSAKFGAEHEWSDTKELDKTTKIYLPTDYIGSVWVAPVEGKVIGTLVVANAIASYTITNFGQIKSGVSRDLLTPAFNVMTTSRPMTPTEFQQLCIAKLGSRRTHPRPPTSGLG